MNRSQGFAMLIACLMAGAILSFAYNGSFSRMMSDDYCTAVIGSQLGAWGGMMHWYETWIGSYTNNWVQSAFAPLQGQAQRWLTGVNIIVWFLILLALFRELFLWLAMPRKISLWFALPLLMIFITLSSLRNLQVLYWLGAVARYTLPISLILLCATLFIWLLRQNRTPLTIYSTMALIAVLVFLVGGFSETYNTFNIVAIGLIAISVWWWMPDRRRQLLPSFLIPMLAAIMSLVLVIAAPGNALRQPRVLAVRSLESTPDLLELAFLVVQRTFELFIIDVYGVAHIILALLAVMMFFLWQYESDNEAMRRLPYPRHIARTALILLGASVLLVAATITPALYATQSMPPRAMFLPRILQISAFMGLGYLLAIYLMRHGTLKPFYRRPIYRLTRLALMALLIFMPILALSKNFILSQPYRVYAQAWDAQHAEIIARVQAGETNVVVDALPFYMEDTLGLDIILYPGITIQGMCANDFYGVATLQIRPPAD